MSAILDEVVGPDMVRPFRPQSDARAIIEPEPTSLWLLLRNLQPLQPPDPLDAFDVHHPPGVSQHGCDPSIAITAVLGGERDDVGGQSRLIIRHRWNLALCVCFGPGSRRRSAPQVSELIDSSGAIRSRRLTPWTGGAMTIRKPDKQENMCVRPSIAWKRRK